MEKKVVLFLLSAFIAGCNNSLLQPSSSTHRIDTIRYPNSTSIMEIVELDSGEKNGVWKHFAKDGTLDSVAHYDKNQLTALPNKEDFNLVPVTYRGIKISFPQKWFVKRDYKGALLFSVDQIGSDTLLAPSVAIQKDTMDKILNLNGYMKSAKLGYNSADSAIFISENTFTINGLPAGQLQYFVTLNKIRGHIIQTIIQDGQTFYIITEGCGSKKWLYIKYEDVFKEIANSFSVVR